MGMGRQNLVYNPSLYSQHLFYGRFLNKRRLEKREKYELKFVQEVTQLSQAGQSWRRERTIKKHRAGDIDQKILKSSLHFNNDIF